jgi:hypothetical protein
MSENPVVRMGLRAGRVREMAQSALAGGGSIICHSTLRSGDGDDGTGARPYRDGEAMCRGFYDAYGPRSNWIRICERLGGFAEVPAP